MLEILRSVRDTILQTEGVGNQFQAFETLTWMLALKVAKAIEDDQQSLAALEGQKFSSSLAGDLDTSVWLARSQGLTGDALITFLRDKLFTELTNNQERNIVADFLKAIFSSVRIYPQSGYKIREALDGIFGLELSTSESRVAMANAYEAIVGEHIQDLSKPMRFYTPRPLVEAIVNLVNPKPHERVFDPAFGTGGFLLHSFLSQMNQAGADADKIKKIQNENINGQEKDGLQFAIGLLNLFLHELSVPRLARINSLAINVRQIGEAQKYDVIFCNPTFDSEEDRAALVNNFTVGSESVEVMFAELIEKSVAQSGRGAVILPEGFFFQTANAYKQVKEDMLTRLNIHSIVSLPHLGVKTSILFFSRPGPTESIWMYSLRLPEGQKLTKKNNYTAAHFEELLRVFAEKPILENAAVVDIATIRAKELNLSVATYVHEPQSDEILLSPGEYLDQIEVLLDSAKSGVAALKDELRDE